ncbi:MAG TPA: MBL fold metallo-hydrolase [Bryobacteraceae bacterium]|nr:MBL fold metallo-hydrolase [Bryobacteraceae bacterium]
MLTKLSRNTADPVWRARKSRLVQLAGTARFAGAAAPQFVRRIQDDRRRNIAPAPFTPNPKKWPDRGLHVAWLGHSTVLFKLDGFTVLTDPVLGRRCGVRMGPVTVGLKRLVAAALSRHELPHIDLILLSHAHFDHFDLATLRALERAGTSVVTAKSTSDLLRVKRYQAVHELGWDEKVRVGPASLRGIAVRHWGARLRSDVHRGFNGYLIETDRYRVVFGGDTALTDTFRSVRSSRPVDLAILPIGAYDPWIRVHCNPEQAWQMAGDCGAERILPVHHQTFRLSREPYLEPVERLLEAAGDTGRVVTTRIGHEWSLD